MALVQIFAKPPVAARVKTRLIADIGEHKAMQVYRYCLRHTLDLVRHSGYGYQIWLSEDSQDPIFNGETYRLQRGPDLGARMWHAIYEQLREKTLAAGRIVLVGADCLDLTPVHLHQAFEALSTNDIVLLPAYDGGYPLIGCRSIDAQLFDRVQWGGSEVLNQTVNNAQSLGYQISILETVRDIDTLADLGHYPELLAIIDDR
ncbi:MAG: TIGR04282 family arsenosugar biosynthesis glycosyltransferase [Gammaproteobacteria bacterium]